MCTYIYIYTSEYVYVYVYVCTRGTRGYMYICKYVYMDMYRGLRVSNWESSFRDVNWDLKLRARDEGLADEGLLQRIARMYI